MRGRGNFLFSLRFYASNALAGALYLVTIFVGKDTLAASCGFFALHKGGQMALCFLLRGMAMYLRASRGEVTANGHISIPIYTCIQMRVFFYISVVDTTTE